MSLPSRTLAHLLTGVAALALAGPAQAQVTIACDQPVVTSRVPCVLTASHGDGKPRTWKWSVVGLDDASQLLEPIAPDKVRVRTPVTLVERSFTVVAVDSQAPSVTGTFVLRITPNPKAGSGERALTEGLFPNAFTPSLVPFQGHPERVSTPLGPGLEFSVPAWQIAFCDDAAMGALDRCWLLACGRQGLRAFKVAGDPVAIPGVPLPEGHRECIAVATLPPGPGKPPDGAPRAVLCETESVLGIRQGYWIYALEADGSRRLLAGGPGTARTDGPGAKARFSLVSDLALDRSGNIYVCEGLMLIRMISLDGSVSTFGVRSSHGTEPELRVPTCLTVDPATGDLYVGGIDGRVVQVTPEGRRTQVVGGRYRALASGHGRELAPPCPGRMPLNTQFDLHLGQLALHGRELLMASHTGLYALHLDTRRLVRILPCDRSLAANRLGPIRYLNPHLPADRCAAIQGCGALALTKEAMALMVVGQGLAELELPDGPITTAMDPPATLPAAAIETKEKQRPAPEDNLWPGQALETGTVRADGQWAAVHWRSAAPDRRFSGQCWVEARGLASGWAQICLLFADKDGKSLGHSEPAGPHMPDVVSAPAHGRTLLRMTGTVPKGADRVALCLRVVKGTPGAVVSFQDVSFQQL